MGNSSGSVPSADDTTANIKVNPLIKQAAKTREVASYDDIRNLSLRLFFLIVVTIFFGEALVMLFLHQWPGLSKPVEAALDALLISSISIPVLYFFFYIPFNQHLNKRKKAEEKLTRFAAIIEQSAEGIVITDVKGTIEFTNPAQCEITGYSHKELIGRNPRLLRSDDHSPEFYDEMWKTLTSGNNWKGVITNKKKDGTLYSVDATISPIFDHDETIVNYVAVSRDITNEMKLEQQFRQAQKMEAVGVLAGGIAHDFNNILSVIIGYTDMASEEMDDDSVAAHEDIAEALKASYRAKDLVRQILTFSRRTDSLLHPLKLGPVVKESLKLMRASLPPSVDIVSNIESHDGMALADPTQISQIIMNLCANASHATNENGMIDVQLKEVHLDEPIISSNQRVDPGPHIMLSVSDNGHGMDQETIDRIFDPFFTTKDVGEGTGLGLAAVYGVVSNHHGVITVESELDKGTTFRAYIPLLAEVPSANKEIISGTSDQLNGNESILVVDDEKAIAIMIKRALSKHGYQVKTTYSASEALAIFNDDPNAFDLLITDLNMPGMSGSELTEQVLAQRPSFPVVMISGFSECDTNSCNDVATCLPKPISMPELMTVIRTKLDKEAARKINQTKKVR